MRYVLRICLLLAVVMLMSGPALAAEEGPVAWFKFDDVQTK